MGLLEIARDFAVANWDNAIMWVIGGILIYLAIKKDMEPTLLLPMVSMQTVRPQITNILIDR